MGDEIRFLSILIWLPIIGGMSVIFSGARFSEIFTKILALALSVITFAISLFIWSRFNNDLGSMQFTELAQWIPAFGIQYALGIDGIALPLIILTTFTTCDGAMLRCCAMAMLRCCATGGYSRHGKIQTNQK